MTSPDEPFSTAERKGESHGETEWGDGRLFYIFIFSTSAFCQLCFVGTQAWRPSTHPHLNKRRGKTCRWKELLCLSQIRSPVRFTSLLLSLSFYPALYFCLCIELCVQKMWCQAYRFLLIIQKKVTNICFVLFFQKGKKTNQLGTVVFCHLRAFNTHLLFFHWFQHTYSECHWFQYTFLIHAQFVVVCIIWGGCFTPSYAAWRLSYSHSPHWTYRG